MSAKRVEETFQHIRDNWIEESEQIQSFIPKEETQPEPSASVIQNTIQNERKKNMGFEDIKTALLKIKDSKRYQYYKNKAATIVITCVF